MSTINLPPDIEASLAAEASKQGSTVEDLAIEKLRTTCCQPTNGSPLANGVKSLHDFLQGFIGTLDSSVHSSPNEQGKFADHLEANYQRQQEEFLRRRESP